MFKARFVTRCVAGETALADPDAFVAVTRVRQTSPRFSFSSSCGNAVGSGAPNATQFDPSAAPPSGGQFSHWYVNDVGELLQLPCVGVRMLPTPGGKLTVGSAVFTGAACPRA
jgi:hypothetical protein